MESDELKFWNWFEYNCSEYTHLSDIDKTQKESLLDEFLMHLHKYCDHLYFQIGDSIDSNNRELIITAEGNIKYFENVEKLIRCSPKVKNWEIIPFKPPRGNDFITEYDGSLFDPKKMKFIPLQSARHPNMLGIKVLIDNFTSDSEQKIIFAIHQVLDSILGEKAATLEIHFLEVGLLKKDGTENNLIDLIDLPNYIDWKKKHRMAQGNS